MLRVLLLSAGMVLAPLAGAADAPASAAAPATNPAPAASPADQVQTFHSALLASMKGGKTMACSVRIDQLGSAIDRTFDLSFIAQKVLRRHWDEISEAQRANFVATFRDLVISTYAQNFSEYGGEVFTTPTTADGSGPYRSVKALLKPTQGDSVTFEYQLHSGADGWRIVNIIADGVSDLATRIPQYDRAIQDKGFDGLLKQLKDQTVKNKAGC
jgi:phospholipid transport system substrate-binding protein